MSCFKKGRRQKAEGKRQKGRINRRDAKSQRGAKKKKVKREV